MPAQKKTDWQKARPNHQGARPREKGRLIVALEAYEKRMIEAALERHQGDVVAVAQDLEINRGGLYKRMDRLEIDVAKYRSWEWVR